MSHWEDYEIYIGIVDDRPHVDPAEYVVALHKNDRTVCHWFTTISRGPENAGRYEHLTETWVRRTASHRLCDSLGNKRCIGYLDARHLPVFQDIFFQTKPRESQFTIFRWLWRCVEANILREEDVWMVSPKFRFGKSSRSWVDPRK